MQFSLITLYGVKVDQEVYEVILPTLDGEIAVFPSHEPLVSVAVPGAIAVRYKKTDTDDMLEYYAISGGVIEVGPDSVQVLVDEADSSVDIVESDSQAAMERAMQMRDDAKDQVELERASQLMDKHAVRLKVADLSRRKRRNY